MLLFLLSICDPKYHPQITFLVETYEHDLLIYAKQILINAGRTNYTYDAEEIVQNTYMKISQYCETVRFYEEPKIMRGYLKRILKNEAMTFLKKYEYIESIEDLEYELVSEDDFVDMINIRERYEEVMNAINSLNEVYSYTLSYRFCDEMEVSEISKLFGVTEKAIYTRIERGKKLLLDSLEKGGVINVRAHK